LSRIDGDQLVDIERRTGRDELCYALEAPIRDRFGSFAGQPQISGTVTWTAANRRVLIAGRRGNERFEELVSADWSVPNPVVSALSRREDRQLART
jgi:hypothetical protein